MNTESWPQNTRVWWDGGEVEFIRWTDRSLVFQWGDARETAVHMPKGAILRLVEKGVLQIEGDAPEWTGLQMRSMSLEAASVQQQAARPERAGLVARLIRKLSGV